MYSFHYQVTAKDEYILLELKGRLMDNLKNEEIKKQIDSFVQKRKLRWIVDASSLEYINSMGLNLLIQLQTKLRTAGGKMVLVRPGEKVQDLLRLTKLNSLFITADSENDAKELLEK